jgi:hypothetical protein
MVKLLEVNELTKRYSHVLYPAPIRDILMQLAVEDLFRAKWTADIHREWIEALLSMNRNGIVLR